MQRQVISIFALLLTTILAGPKAWAADPGPCQGDDYWIGAARSDITGPLVGLGMLGYANIKQSDQGLHMRLWSRAMVVSDGCQQQTVALVIADLGMVFGGLKEAVIKALQQELPGVFTRDNVLLSATHTHSGPGGFAHHALYNITTLGFSRLNFDSIVRGTVQSVVEAYRQQQKASLQIQRGELQGVQFNRSPEAFANNPEPEKQLFPGAADPEMLLIKAVSSSGKDLAAFNWFAVHGVSLPMESTLVSGDNKGLAAYLLEQKMAAVSPNFVAGFVQAQAGDISPYALHQPEPTVDEFFKRNEVVAEAQFAKALELFKAASEPLQGPVQSIHQFADLAYRQVDADYTEGEGPQRTCQAALGVSFAAGTENGKPVPVFNEGTVWGVNWKKITVMPQEQACQKEKVILLPTGFAKPHPWTARVVPFQLIRIGQLVVIGAPFEVTTVAGQRMKTAVLQALAPLGVRYVAISALANEYIHYVTTREEYAKQAYEGGSNLYGPWSLAAYTQIFEGLARDLREGRQPEDEAQPLDLSQSQVELRPTVVFDAVPRGKQFGDCKDDAAARYQAGETVRVSFWGAHPNNSIGLDSTLLTVEQLQAGRWIRVRNDNDPDTIYHWRRQGLGQSVIDLSWKTTESEAGGIFRVCHQGHSKAFLGGSLKGYAGCSRSFELEALSTH